VTQDARKYPFETNPALLSPWLTLRQAAAYVHRGPRFLGREIRDGRLRAARVGGRGEVLTRREWLDEWVVAMSRPVTVVPRRSA
jgi:excisionase family DNA binding protein